MRIRATLPLALAILLPVLPLAAATHTLDGLVHLVRDATAQQQSDGDLARALHRVELDERLDNRTAEELESLVPGPKSIAELERLREATVREPMPKALPQFPSPPAPGLDELRDVLAEARHKAIAYTASLPDFICTETVGRYEQHMRGWTLRDTLTLELTYFGHAENYKLTALDGRPTTLTYAQLGGAWSRGEFGSMLLAVFSPASQAVFRWSNWTTLRHRTAYVLSFQIDLENSRYSLTAGTMGMPPATARVGEHGLIYIDRETKDVIRLDSVADSIPKGFLLAAATRTLDYGLAEVGGVSFLLPLRADVRLAPRDNNPPTRNHVEFTAYRKFTGESEISFGDAVEEKK